MLTAKVQSGIDALDQAWEGLYRGAAYLLYGRARSGRDLMMLHLARTAMRMEESCVLVSPRRPRDLSIQASMIGFDLDEACRSGRVRLLRIPPELSSSDSDSIERALLDLARLAREAAPDRLLVEDFTPFVRFASFERLRHTVLRFLDALTETETTTVLALGEPASVGSREVISFMRDQVAGTIHLAPDPGARSSTARRLSLLPGLDSLEPETTVSWDLTGLRNAGGPVVQSPLADPSPDVLRGDGASELTVAPFGSISGGQFGHEEGHAQVAVAPVADVVADIMADLGYSAVGGDQSDEENPTEAPIRFFDPHDPHGPAPELDDPFAAFGMPMPFLKGAHYVEGNPEEGVPAGEPQDLNPFASEAAAGGERASDPARIRPPQPEEVSRHGAQVELSRKPVLTSDPAVFSAAFDRAAWEYRVRGTSFLVLALRVAPGDPAVAHYDALAESLNSVADPEDVLLVDRHVARLALLLPGRTGEAAQTTFQRLKAVLRSTHPEAVTALGAVSAMVVPNGEPFSTAGEFLAHVMTGA